MLVPMLIILALSDFHLGRGQAAPEIDDFPAEAWRAHLRMLAAYLASLPAGVLCDHVLNGDWFDFLAIPDNPHLMPGSQEAALAKAKTILKAYPDYFIGLRALLKEHSNLKYRIVIGNHDLQFRWPDVRTLVLETLGADGTSGRVTFHDEDNPYAAGGGAVLYVHGAEFDKPASNPSQKKAFKRRVILPNWMTTALLFAAFFLSGWCAERVFWWMPSTIGTPLSFSLLFFLGRRLAKRSFGRVVLTLNERLSSRLHASFGMWLRKGFFPEIGRRSDHGDMYMLGLARKPYAAPLIALAFLLEIFRYDPDEWLELSVVIWNTTGADQYRKGLHAFFWKHPAAEHVIGGHTHIREVAAYQIGNRKVRYYNGGLSGLQVHTSKPEVRCRTSWTKTETFVRRIGYHWTHAFPQAAFSTIAYAALPAALLLLPPLPVLHALRWPVAILALLLLLVRQATAAYVDRTFFQLCPIVTHVYADGTVSVRPFRYDPETDRFEELETV